MPSRNIPVKVFLADDSAMIRTRVAAMLSAPMMDIVGQGETPLDCVRGILATHPDVVVLDVQLRGGTGLDVLRAVRANGAALADVAFVVFSNNSTAPYRKRYLEAGALRFLDKASEFDQLPQAVADACATLA